MKKLRSPISWVGGKFYNGRVILNFFPKHDYYAEVFGGAAQILFMKPISKFEVYNDLDEGLYNFFKVLRDNFDEFYRLVCLSPFSRKTYEYCKEKYFKNEFKNDIEKAWMFYILARWAFGADFGKSFGVTISTIRKNMPLSCSHWLSSIELLPEIHQRIMRIQIENLHWKNFLDKYNWEYEKGFYYLDPPYVLSTRTGGGYKYEMNNSEHEELVKYLIDNQNKKRFLLSGYDNEIYKKLEDEGWNKYCWNTICRIAGKTKLTNLKGENKLKERQQRQECIWYNYKINEKNSFLNKKNSLF